MLRTVYRVISEFNKLIPVENFLNNKMGGPGRLIQIDETMLNFKAKSHRCRSPSNRTFAICIVETSNNIIKAFAKITPNKKASTLIPIINLCSCQIVYNLDRLTQIV
ncbi:hypothetical protein DMUE_0007 [Dictyocoela muelleri]|nr:hypothetical protein DMUE_0007 [Dictyocoela muelleri]